MYVYMHACMYVRMCEHVCVCARIHTRTCLYIIHALTRAHLHAHVHCLCIYMCTRTCVTIHTGPLLS